jgi:hypothetical protein
LPRRAIPFSVLSLKTPDPHYKIVRLANGTRSVHSLAEAETFHPVIGPVAEARALYINQLNLRERLAALACQGGSGVPPLSSQFEEAGSLFHSGPNPANTDEFVLWDVGLGAGGNILTVFGDTSDLGCPLRVVSFDHTTEPLRFALDHAAELGYVERYSEPAAELLRNGRVAFQNGAQPVRWELRQGDFPELLLSKALFPAPHAILFDAFSPAKNPAMWTAPFFANLYRRLYPQRPCAMPTYSRSTMLRVTLLLAGFFVGVGHATGEKEETTVAANSLSLLDQPLPPAWLRRARLSKSAEPMWEPVYRQAPLATGTWEKLQLHPQFNGRL